ncbi:MAG: tRNA (adenosine(37)-N6)-threonylcarbamoyltransferase complex ATPase subunit type 1 TsaE, partial [Gammaproteobacteria bacterium]|nr:tRNA (adenosine(37)-N6)-threonylcarbamoyltransferase complex ATPase subunit type 1 TsaE [Gammaproteobacteria bacterium]
MTQVQQDWLQHLADEAATVEAGRQLGLACLANGLQRGLLVFLHGQLGAGKTTLSGGVLRAFGHRGGVKSPTYTLVEPYDFSNFQVYHFDLYRLGDAEELEYMGLRDYLHPHSLSLVEWPQRGRGALPAEDLQLWLELDPKSEGR